MKKKITYLLLSAIIVGIFMFSCTNTTITPLVNNSSDTVSFNDLMLDAYPTPFNYGFDIDNDGIPDISFNGLMYVTGSATDFYTKINLQTNFAALTKMYTINTWCLNGTGDTTWGSASEALPKMLTIGDTIFATDTNWLAGSIFIAHYYNSGSIPPPCSTNSFNQLILNKDAFIPIRKTINGETYLGWIKVKVYSAYEIILRSYRKMTKTDTLKIE
jgi:hypothetical protein